MGKLITISGPQGVDRNGILTDLEQRWFIEPVFSEPNRDGLSGEALETPIYTLSEIIASRANSNELRSVALSTGQALGVRRSYGEAAVKSVYVAPSSWGEADMRLLENRVKRSEIEGIRAREAKGLGSLPKFDQVVVEASGADRALAVARYINDSCGVELDFCFEPRTH